MGAYILRRLLQVIPILIGVSFLVWVGMYLSPGDPVMVMLTSTTSDTVLSGAQIEQLREQYGLDKPLPLQYATFAWHAVHGDLGRSWRTNQPVMWSINQEFPYTLHLTVVGLSIAILLGVVMGLVAALRHNTTFDTILTLLTLIFVSLPSFWLGLVLIFIFVVWLNVITAIGTGDWQHLILPALTLGIGGSATIARLTRVTLLEVLHQEYIVTARSKGLPERLIMVKHALRNAMIPVVTVVGLHFGSLLGGSLVVEEVFGRPGLGQLAVNAINGKDFPMVQGIVLFSATIYVLVNLAVDVLYAWLDPRIRLA